MSDTMPNIGKQITFADLFHEFKHIQIPIIQRDYVQGRAGQEELRNEFLSALKGALDKNDDSDFPLDLDFVYGSAFGNGAAGNDSFAPLDGQQRLTTLFLLHWYLAWKDEKIDDFRQRFLDDQRSRFAYEVRPSSHDFFNTLASHFPEEATDDVDSLRALIEDKPWFFQAWNHDPTIRSGLAMLQAIHEMFRESEGYYQRLIEAKHPRITFQLLELRDFGLSDDLYIKMNARGKPLTAFENFKARLEQRLDDLFPGETYPLNGMQVSIREYFSRRMDTTWADLFWQRRNPETHLYDRELMRLIKAVALVSLDPTTERASKTVSELRTPGENISFSKLVDLGCLNEKMLKTLMAVLDYWSAPVPCEGGDDSIVANRAVFNSQAAFNIATGDERELSYPELVKFAALCSFVRTHSLPLNLQNCGRWLRVISNLVENSDIERPDDFTDALKALIHLETQADRILDYLAERGEVTAFNRQQVREERIKAELMKDEPWQEPIYAAEGHGYFKGQIEFLLNFSGVLDHWTEDQSINWSAEEQAQVLERFRDYLARAEAIFDSKGLREFRDNKWERALLALGDYTLKHGMNWSFLQNSSSERRPTWKLLLRGQGTEGGEEKRQLVKTLLDKIDLNGDVEVSLDEVISTASTDERWRQALVETPAAIPYCEKRALRWNAPNEVYLLKKIQMNGAHAELFSFCLNESVLIQLSRDGRLKPLTLRTYQSVSGADIEPYIPLSFPHEGYSSSTKIRFGNGKFHIVVDPTSLKDHPDFVTELTTVMGFMKIHEALAKVVEAVDMEKTLVEFAQATARAFEADPFRA